MSCPSQKASNNFGPFSTQISSRIYEEKRGTVMFLLFLFTWIDRMAMKDAPQLASRRGK
jgi:hypothetical protein